MASSGMLRRVALVRTDVSGERSDFVIRVTRIGELGTTLVVSNNRRRLLLTANVVPSSPILVTHGATSRKTLFFIVTAVKTSNLIYFG
jgi:hypothetical protein